MLSELVAMGNTGMLSEERDEEQGVRKNSLLKLGVYFSDEIRNLVSCERNYAFADFIGIWRVSIPRILEITLMSW